MIVTVEDMIVTVEDVRAVRTGAPNGLCVRGMRTWFAHHGMDFDDFVRNGIAIERLEATGDHYALLVCKAARERAARA